MYGGMPLLPLLTYHEVEAFLAYEFAHSKGKELLASETVWGATDDAKHVEVMRYTLGELRRRGIC